MNCTAPATRIHQALLLGLCLLLVLPGARAEGEDKPKAPPTPDVSVRELIETEQESEKVVEEVTESGARGQAALSTPLKTLATLRKAVQERDWETAGEYLDTRYLPEEVAGYEPRQLMRALDHVFSQQNLVNLAQISDVPEGDLNDGLPDYREKIGEVTLVEETIPILLQRIPDGKGGRIWKISNATVAEIPKMWEELGYSPVATYLATMLPDINFMGMDSWQVLATIIFLIVSWPLASIASRLLARAVLSVWDRFPVATENFIRGPFRFFLFILIARTLIDHLGLSLTARILLDHSGVDYIAFTVLLMGLLSFVRDFQLRKMQQAGNAHYAALIKPFTTIVKTIAIVIIALVWAESAGYNMSTVLAGLGVGSLAVALAAQKTMENVIGAITLYTARPVKAGDFCRFGTATGTVEEIGLRSTIIRTLDRTQVVIPNAVFSSTEVENFSARDRIRYYRQFRLQLGSAEQLRYILAQIRGTLYAHPQLPQDSVSARFEKIEDAAAWLRLDALVDTTDYQQYLAVAEDLNLRIVEIVQEAGASFCGPARLLQEGESPTEESAARVRQVLEEWREQNRLPFPDHSEEEIAQFKGSLDFPPRGSPT